jgi:hypothetical protein
MFDKVAPLGTGIGKTKLEDNIVKPSLQQNEQIRSGNIFLPLGFLKKQVELLFGQPVQALCLLLFPELNSIIGYFSSAPLSVLARCITPPVKSALIRITSIALKK